MIKLSTPKRRHTEVPTEKAFEIQHFQENRKTYIRRNYFEIDPFSSRQKQKNYRESRLRITRAQLSCHSSEEKYLSLFFKTKHTLTLTVESIGITAGSATKKSALVLWVTPPFPMYHCSGCDVARRTKRPIFVRKKFLAWQICKSLTLFFGHDGDTRSFE